MRIAVVTPDWPAFCGGGIAALSRTLAESLARAGDDVEVWTRGGGRRDRALRQHRSRVPVVGLRGRSWARRGARLWGPALEREHGRYDPSAVIAMSWEPLAGGWRPTGGDLFVFAHGRDITGAVDEVRDCSRRSILQDPDVRWLCLTRWMSAELKARGARRVTVVPAAVPIEPETARRGIPAGQRRPHPLRALCVGRLIPRKGHDRVIAAVRSLGGRVELRIVGEGPDHARLAALAAGCPWIQLRGYLAPEALNAAWSDSDVFLMPARTEPQGDTEGYGLVFLEAGLRGLPVIGGRAAGAAEAVIDGVTGFLVADDPAGAAVGIALDRLTADRALGERMGAAGRARVLGSHAPAHLAAAVRRAAASAAAGSPVGRPVARPPEPSEDPLAPLGGAR